MTIVSVFLPPEPGWVYDGELIRYVMQSINIGATFVNIQTGRPLTLESHTAAIWEDNKWIQVHNEYFPEGDYLYIHNKGGDYNIPMHLGDDCPIGLGDAEKEEITEGDFIPTHFVWQLPLGTTLKGQDGHTFEVTQKHHHSMERLDGEYEIIYIPTRKD